MAKLEPPLDKRFIKIMDEQPDVIPFEFSEMFIDGFKLGGKDDGRGFQGRVEGQGQEKADALRGTADFFGGLLTSWNLQYYWLIL